jgi:uncharacterized caspase-like protein
VRFAGVRIPRDGRSEIEFAAYAFNQDRVKSSTSRYTHVVPPGLTPRRGRAYLVTVGVNAYENPQWDLVYAAKDARVFRQILSRSLKEAGRYKEVVAVSLVSDRKATEGGGVGDLVEADATAANLRSVLGRLAGVGQVQPGAAPEVERLRTAEPEDLLVITFSGHGTVDDAGLFYMFPYDIGPAGDRKVTDRLLARAVSSDELSRWLRDIDAGEMVLIVDACHSAAAIESGGFKAGPMGSRGLGQLAYDKGMRILAASQADSFAIESKLTGHGLLTYALARDGLEAGRADHRPRDLSITLSEWLEYGGLRVPQLAEKIVRGERPKSVTFGVSAVGRSSVGADGRRRITQQPALFDFSRRRAESLLSKVSPQP